jgi:hypothetical protein
MLAAARAKVTRLNMETIKNPADGVENRQGLDFCAAIAHLPIIRVPVPREHV